MVWIFVYFLNNFLPFGGSDKKYTSVIKIHVIFIYYGVDFYNTPMFFIPSG